MRFLGAWNKNRYPVKFFAAFTVVVIFFVSLAVFSNRSGVLQNGFGRHFISLYRSLRKLPDVVFFPYFFQKTNLPVYDLTIKREDLALLNAALPADPFSGRLQEDNRVEVKADFTAEDFRGEVKVRYRGFGTDHWNANKKSWRINFTSERGPKGMKAMNLIIPSDRGYFVEPLLVYRAKKLGLSVPEVGFVRLRLNGQDVGVYLASEHFSSRWLSRSGLPDTSNILAVEDGKIAEIAYEAGPYLVEDRLKYWKSYTDKNITDFPELVVLIDVITKTDDDTFKKLIPHLVDMPKFYAWDIMRILSGSNHQSDNYNLILLFNTAVGKFEFVPFDINLLDQREIVYNDADMVLTKRVFSVPEFKAERDKLLKEYLTEENLQDDLAFYDSEAARFSGDFLNDLVKIDNNLRFLSKIKNYRRLIADNFQRAKSIPETDCSLNLKSSSFSHEWPGSFSRFEESVWSREHFLAKNPRFYAGDGADVAIGPGEIILSETVIVPAGVRLLIQPRTTLLMGMGVSLVSYSPLRAMGAPENRIRIKSSGFGPWGSLLLIDTGQKSIISLAEISGGSGVKINGIISTGMVAAHKSDLEVLNSVFSKSGDDDLLNIKYGRAEIRGSFFYDSFSDAIDLDSAGSDSQVRDNTFLPPIGMGSEAVGGDAIDISFSGITISGNKILKGCGDKGISVGEDSGPVIKDNFIEGCAIGVAVKDASRARILRNHFVKNVIAVSAYRKKMEFSDNASAVVIASLFEGNSKDTETRGGSEIKIFK